MLHPCNGASLGQACKRRALAQRLAKPACLPTPTRLGAQPPHVPALRMGVGRARGDDLAVPCHRFGANTPTTQQGGFHAELEAPTRAALWPLGQHWIGRAACCAAATAVTLGLLAGAAGPDLAAAAAAAQARQPALAVIAQPRQVQAEQGIGASTSGPRPAVQEAFFSYPMADMGSARTPTPGGGDAGDATLLLAVVASDNGGAGAPAGPLASSSGRSEGRLARSPREPLLLLADHSPSSPSPWDALAQRLRPRLGLLPQSDPPSTRAPGQVPGASTSSPAPLWPAASDLSFRLDPAADPGLHALPAAPPPASPRPPAASAPSAGGEVASESEDRLLEAARQVEARLEGVLGALAGGVPGLGAGQQAAQESEVATAAAHSLIREVWEVVDAAYLDARDTGFDRQRWAGLRDAALAQPYRDTAAGYRAVRDLLARGLSDPYCRFIGPAELEAMKKYDVSGVGLNLGTAAEYVVKTGNALPAPRDPSAGEGIYVVGVSKGSPADAAGMRQGDELLAIQGETLAESTPFRAAGLIAGAAEERSAADGSGGGGAAAGAAEQRGGAADEVRVLVRHASGEAEECVLRVPPRRLPSAVSTSLSRSAVTLPGGGRGEELVGTVRLASFNARAQSDVAAAIRQLEAGGATRLVLDLRDNRGGLVAEGIEVARLFLEGDAPIVITERRDAPPDTPRAPGPALTSAPLLVLVNGHTASASEIVAGALRDNCRAVLAGSRTYGKGLIQSVYELSDGSGLVITVGKYMTPRGTDIDRYGIKPDYSSVPSVVQYDTTIKACKLPASDGAVPAAARAALPA